MRKASGFFFAHAFPVLTIAKFYLVINGIMLTVEIQVYKFRV